MVKRALGVMVKVPRLGEVKTRLIPPLTKVEAKDLYEAFLRDITLRLKSLSPNIDVHIFFTPDDSTAVAELSAIFEGYRSFIPQSGGDLGERLESAFERLFNDGYESIAIIGSDSPDLPVEYIEAAFSRLGSTSAEVVLGSATDGGYYLVAMSAKHYSIFRGINWSTSSVLNETLERAKAEGIRVELLDEWYDIDTFEDLKILSKSKDVPYSLRLLEESGLIKKLTPR